MTKNANYGSHGADRKAPPTKTPRFNDVSFVNYTLPPAVAQTLKESPFSPEAGWKAIHDLNDTGYTVKFRYDEKYQNYTAFIQHSDPNHVNAGIILSGRGSSCMKALKQACFIHYEVTQAVWAGFIEPKAVEIDD